MLALTRAGCPPMVPVVLIWVQVPMVVQAGAGAPIAAARAVTVVMRAAGAACEAPRW